MDHMDLHHIRLWLDTPGIEQGVIINSCVLSCTLLGSGAGSSRIRTRKELLTTAPAATAEEAASAMMHLDPVSGHLGQARVGASEPGKPSSQHWLEACTKLSAPACGTTAWLWLGSNCTTSTASPNKLWIILYDQRFAGLPAASPGVGIMQSRLLVHAGIIRRVG